MVIIFEAQVAVMPAGKLVGEPIPVAPTVLWVILVTNTVPMHKDGVDEAAPTVLAGLTVIVPVALTLPQPPVNGMV